jgi:hypothetical protein
MKNLLLLVLSLALAASCAKYPEGGLRKLAKGHIMGEWKMNAYFMNGFDYSDTVLVQNFKETFNEGGTFERAYIDTAGAYHSYGGGWDIAGERTVLKIFADSTYKLTPMVNNTATNFNIDRLTKEDLWYSFESSNGTHQLRFSKIK